MKEESFEYKLQRIGSFAEEGWIPRIKHVKDYKYITFRKSGKEESLAPYSFKLWEKASCCARDTKTMNWRARTCKHQRRWSGANICRHWKWKRKPTTLTQILYTVEFRRLTPERTKRWYAHANPDLCGHCWAFEYNKEKFGKFPDPHPTRIEREYKKPAR